jgi:CheY-like chemotaxis protein
VRLWQSISSELGSAQSALPKIQTAERLEPVVSCSAMAKASDDDVRRRVLLVEDDDILRQNYEMLLTAHGLSVAACATKSAAIAAFSGETFDVVILDIALGSDYEAGFDLCQRFREKQKTVPIIFLTQRDEDADRISALRLGGLRRGSRRRYRGGGSPAGT